MTFVEKILFAIGYYKHDWEIIDSATTSERHYYYNDWNPSRRNDERVVWVTYVIRRCKLTGVVKAMKFYGTGSLYADRSIDKTKAEMIIKQIKDKTSKKTNGQANKTRPTES